MRRRFRIAAICLLVVGCGGDSPRIELLGTTGTTRTTGTTQPDSRPEDVAGPLPLQQPLVMTLSAHVDAERVSTDATLVVEALPPIEGLAEPFDPMSPAVLRGSIEAVGDGWDLRGFFDAHYCPQLNTYAVCE